VYIGQSGSVGNRLVQHNQNKDFWNRALVAISCTNSLTQTHALFLEWFVIQQTTQAGR
jgi:aspartate-semialdehyde dehydrogenase